MATNAGPTVISGYRVFELEVGGAVVISVGDTTEGIKERTSPLALTVWGSKVDLDTWTGTR